MKIKIKYVSISNDRWVYSPRKTKELANCSFPVDSHGFLVPPIKLGIKDDSTDKIIKAYIAAKGTLLADGSCTKSQLGYICEKYLSSERFQEKSAQTQNDYKNLSKAILSHKLIINGIPASLTDMQLESLTKPVMNEIRHERLEVAISKGHDGCAYINRQVAFLRTAIDWGLNNIYELPQIANPLSGIDKFKKQPITRYITDEEMLTQCKEAKKVSDYLPLLIRLSYLLGTRGVETSGLRYSDCIEAGINIKQLKGPKNIIIAWSPTLKEIIDGAKILNKTRGITDFDPPIITNSRGDALTPHAIQSAMSRLKKHMMEKGLGDIFFTLQKIRLKTYIDAKDGHVSSLSSHLRNR